VEEEEASIQTDSRIDWKAVDESEWGPPEPVFNSEDSSECRDIINELYEDAMAEHEWRVGIEVKLNKSYQGLLDR